MSVIVDEFRRHVTHKDVMGHVFQNLRILTEFDDYLSFTYCKIGEIATSLLSCHIEHS